MEGSSSSYVLTTLLILLTFTSYICLASGESNTGFIRKSCNATMYPKLCFTSLSSYASAIQTSPKVLAYTALSVTLDRARDASTRMRNLSRSYEMKPIEVSAMRDCVEEFTNSVAELRDSLKEMNKIKDDSDFELKMSNIQTWVSAALTDDDTCTDGFDGEAMNEELKSMVRSVVVNVAHLTSNALALINSYASLHGH